MRGERRGFSLRWQWAVMFLALLAAGTAIAAEESPKVEPPFEPWVFGHIVWEDESTTESIYELVAGYEEHGIPVDGVIIDSPWATHYNTFDFDPQRFPHIEKLIADLHRRNIKVILWITSMVNVEDPEYQTCLERGYFVPGRERTKWWKGVGGMIDYDNPEAVAWWHARMNKAIDLGIDAWKCDGTDPFMLYEGWEARQRYSEAYYSDFYYYTRERSGRKTLIMARPLEQILNESVFHLPTWTNPLGLGLYLQFAPVEISFLSWVGDQDPTFDGLRLALRWILASAKKGYLILGSDIGGYRSGGPTKEVFLRWAQMGAFMPFMENGGCGEHRPWKFDEETVKIYRTYVLLHKALSDYLWKHAVERWQEGRSLIAPLSRGRDHYLLGPELLIAPIEKPGGKVRIVLPEGSDWIPLFREIYPWAEKRGCVRLESDSPGRILKGGCSFSAELSLTAYPVFLRAGGENPFRLDGVFPELNNLVLEDH